MKANDYILVTGATGFVGHYTLMALLRDGHRCVALTRPGGADPKLRLRSLLRAGGLEPSEYDEEQLLVVPAVLPGDLPDLRGVGIEAVLHIAGVTRFDRDQHGEPYRTNVEGTRALLDWADAHGAHTFHLVSTAYVCGRQAGPIPERIDAKRPEFHNAYEESKWQAEQLCAAWARRGDRQLTVLRPSIVVGDWTSGRATQFHGFYMLARATELLARSLEGADEQKRHNVRLRLPGRPDSPNELVPVDFVAEAIARIVTSPAHHGEVYHLTHTDPPTHDRIKTWIERVFDLGGGGFAGPDAPPVTEMSTFERLFFQAAPNALTYLVDPPRFERHRTEQVLRALGVACRDIDEAFIKRLIDFGRTVRWGKTKAPIVQSLSPAVDGYCARYFEQFLPEHLPQSRVARMAAVTATVRFVIEDEPQGVWTCRFERGRLVEVRRGENGMAEQFGYRTTLDGFWDAIGGRATGEALFLAHRADVFGDVERALKMAAILQEFTREFPCDRRRLAQYSPTT